MQALVVTPGTEHSTRVADVGEPAVRDGEVLVRVLEVGVCGTDREIDHGLFGVAPEGEETLVIGHELLGVVERDGGGFARGDLVAATVRRSCGHCLACAEASPDSCLTGDYRERGITRLHGFARELVAEDGDQLIPIPRALGRLGVLAEPTSICARALRHATAIGGRQPWRLRRALVVGAGAVGLLTTFLLRLRDVEVWTASLEPENALVEGSGARYVSTRETPLAELGSFDLVVEAAGDAQLMADSLGLLRRNGVACLLGIDGREQRVGIDGRVLGVDTILENRVLFGSVNAQRQDWLAGVEALDEAHRRWPGALDAFVGLRVPLDRFAEAFAEQGGKATLVVSEDATVAS
ncbi:MAG: alcohol dehydrogenase catalytic domain-containing protein [Pseudomonadota bacterium]